MAGFAQEIGDHPVFVPLLDRLEFQSEHLAASQSAAEQQGDYRVVAQSAKGRWGLGAEEAPALFRREPVSLPHPEAPHALHAPNARRLFRTEETGIGRLVAPRVGRPRA